LKKLSLNLLLIGIAFTAQSQRIVHQQSLYWIRYQNQLAFSPSLYLNAEFDNRRFFNPDVQNQFITHFRLHYKKKNWDFASGVTLSWAYAQMPELGYDQAVNELRGVNEVTHEFSWGKFSLQNRLRLDHRVFQEDIDKSVFEESYYVLRFRYRPLLKIPLYVNEQDISVINLRVSDEIMFNHTKNTFDQNRIYVNTDFYLSKKLSLDLGYIYIYQQRFGRNEFFERHVVRFTVLHKIQLY
jgi:hypothetical protein